MKTDIEAKEINFTIGEMLGIALTLVVTGIGIAYGLEVMADIRDDMAEDSCVGRDDNLTTWNATSGECYNATNIGGGGLTSSIPTTVEYNATVDAMTGVAKLPEKMPTIATIIVAAIIIGILITYLWGRFAR